MSRRLVLIGALALAACGGSSNSAEPGAGEKIDAGNVALYATAPDGTKLWAVEGRNGRTVYFAASGSYSHHPETCGKSCVQEVPDQVPTLQSPVRP